MRTLSVLFKWHDLARSRAVSAKHKQLNTVASEDVPLARTSKHVLYNID
jgi:hypothetical protein